MSDTIEVPRELAQKMIDSIALQRRFSFDAAESETDRKKKKALWECRDMATKMVNRSLRDLLVYLEYHIGLKPQAIPFDESDPSPDPDNA